MHITAETCVSSFVRKGGSEPDRIHKFYVNDTLSKPVQVVDTGRWLEASNIEYNNNNICISDVLNPSLTIHV